MAAASAFFSLFATVSAIIIHYMELRGRDRILPHQVRIDTLLMNTDGMGLRAV